MFPFKPSKQVIFWTLNTCDTKIQFPEWMRQNKQSFNYQSEFRVVLVQH